MILDSASRSLVLTTCALRQEYRRTATELAIIPACMLGKKKRNIVDENEEEAALLNEPNNHITLLSITEKEP